MKKLILCLTIALAVAAEARAGELKVAWSQKNPTGRIWDMKFMPNPSQIILTADSSINIINTDNGKTFASYPIPSQVFPALEFLPDSTQFVLINGSFIQKMNLSDMNVIAYDSIPSDYPYGFKTRFYRLAIDPVRPLAYAIINNGGNVDDIRNDSGRIVVYNLETMKQQTVLEGSVLRFLSRIAVSHDGKYLAATTHKRSRLLVWSLADQKLIRDEQLIRPIYNDDPYMNDTRTDLHFSHSNSSKLFFSNNYNPDGNRTNSCGLFVYDIDSAMVVDSTFANKSYKLDNGIFSFLGSDEKIAFVFASGFYILDTKKKEIEYSKELDLSFPIYELFAYDTNTQQLIGTSGNYHCLAKLDLFSNAQDYSNDTTIIYPNPTSNIVNVLLKCTNSFYYQVFDSFGNIIIDNQLVLPDHSQISFDTSSLSDGCYFIRTNCEGIEHIYKFVKKA